MVIHAVFPILFCDSVNGNPCCFLFYSMTVCCAFRVFVVGSKDMNTRVFAVQPCENLVVHSMGGHTDAVVGAFFEHNCMDVSFATARFSFIFCFIA